MITQRVDGIVPSAVHAYTDERGFRTLQIDGGVPTVVASAFENDVQTPRTAATIAERIVAVEEGRDPSRSFSGNSCTVTIYPGIVNIENHLLDDDLTIEMAIEQYRLILNAWVCYLTS